jgi:hypothetical protein
MSALAIFDPLAELLDSEPVERCRFCGCTGETPCRIALAVNSDDKECLAGPGDEVLGLIPCNWYIEEVCNAPACIEKLIEESRVRLFGSDGRKLA